MEDVSDDQMLAKELGASMARAESRTYEELTLDEQRDYQRRAEEVLREERLADLERICQS